MDQGPWQLAKAQPEAVLWPDWKGKILHARRRVVLGAELLQIGDEDAASEEFLYALSHLARALLLRANVFPLSRGEVVGQVVGIGYPDLGELMVSLTLDGGENGTLRRAQLYAGKLLKYLDREAYAT